jgi:phosphopantetheinyl transferase (holo-ACP synthase)
MEANEINNIAKDLFDNLDRTEKLSNEFSRIINEWLTADEIKAINKANAEDKEHCATHQYCDPNEAMLQAFETVIGREFVFFDAEIPNTESQQVKDDLLITIAWNLSRKNNFAKPGQ